MLTTHGDERVDDWYWLRDRDDPEVIAYLEAENAYADAMLAPLVPLRDRIFEEIKARVQETDESAPVAEGPWEYTSRTIEGSQYAIHCRRPRGARSRRRRDVVLDENVLADGHDYFALGGFEVTPDHAVLAYSVDFNGGERYTLRFRDLATGADLPDVVEDVTYGLAWADDARTCFYVRPDDAMRPNEVWRHVLGTPAADDVLVLREDDERFYLGVERTRSGRFVLIDASSKLTSEVWFVPTDAPEHAAARHRAARARPRVRGRAPLERGARRPVPHRHEPGRRGPELRARRRARASIPARAVLDAARPAPRRRQARRGRTRSPSTSC